MKKRIWELDALRGVCIVGMICVHLLFDLWALFGILDLSRAPVFDLFLKWGGVPFLLISGICVTFSARSVKRGALVFFFGMVCSLVTAGIYLLSFTGKSILIYFGVLHCLGACMMLWPLFRKLPTWFLAIAGIFLIALGLYFTDHVRTDTMWLLPFGILPRSFASSDYFPLLPNLGYFLLGAVLGKTIYAKRQSVFPRINTDFFLIRFFSFIGRHSLLIYLVHQPLLAGGILLMRLLLNC